MGEEKIIGNNVNKDVNKRKFSLNINELNSNELNSNELNSNNYVNKIHSNISNTTNESNVNKNNNNIESKLAVHSKNKEAKTDLDISLSESKKNMNRNKKKFSLNENELNAYPEIYKSQISLNSNESENDDELSQNNPYWVSRYPRIQTKQQFKHLNALALPFDEYQSGFHSSAMKDMLDQCKVFLQNEDSIDSPEYYTPSIYPSSNPALNKITSPYHIPSTEITAKSPNYYTPQLYPTSATIEDNLKSKIKQPSSVKSNSSSHISSRDTFFYDTVETPSDMPYASPKNHQEHSNALKKKSMKTQKEILESKKSPVDLKSTSIPLSNDERSLSSHTSGRDTF